MSKQKKQVKSNIEIIRGMRGDWGAISPVTKVIPDKRRKPPKHKGRQYDD